MAMIGDLGPVSSLAVLVMISMCLLAGGTLFYGEIAATYGLAAATNATDGTSYAASFQKLNSTTNAIADTLRTSDTSNSNPFLVYFAGGFQALKDVFLVFDAIKDMAGGVLGFVSSVGGGNLGVITGLLLGALAAYYVFNFAQTIVGRRI